MDNRPKIFVSSTIYDFRDLRSAIQFWLSEMGFEVRMSERNDFVKDSNANSYQACLDSIAECDYYILLIGSRVGGLYSDNPKISITQKEYQYANELSLQGKIKKMLIFVRKNILDIKEDRKALEKLIKENFIAEKELEGKEKLKDIHLYSSNFVNDADFIFNFINQVGKTAEMKEAIKNNSDQFPSHNWINAFDSFKDITDVLKIELKIHSNLSVKRMTEIVLQELSSNCTYLVRKTSIGIVPWYCIMKSARKKLPKIMGEAYKISKFEMKQIALFLNVGNIGLKNLSVKILVKAIESGVYLNYDSNKDDFNTGNIQKSLNEILENIERLKVLGESFNTDFILNANEKLNINSESDKDSELMTLNSSDPVLFLIYAAFDCHYNICELLKYLFAVLKDTVNKNNYEYPKLYPKGVFEINIDDLILPEVKQEDIYNCLSGAF